MLPIFLECKSIWHKCKRLFVSQVHRIKGLVKDTVSYLQEAPFMTDYWFVTKRAHYAQVLGTNLMSFFIFYCPFKMNVRCKDNLTSSTSTRREIRFKGIVQPHLKILSSFILPHGFVINTNDWLLRSLFLLLYCFFNIHVVYHEKKVGMNVTSSKSPLKFNLTNYLNHKSFCVMNRLKYALH